MPFVLIAALLLLVAAPASAASVSLTPAAGPADRQVSLSGRGLPALSVVEARVGRGKSELLVADDRGRFQAELTVPRAARGRVPVTVETGDEHARLTYRVASRFSGRRAAETSDWEGHVMRVSTKLDIGELVTRVRLSGLGFTANVAVTQGGRRVASGSARGRGPSQIKVRLPGSSAGKLLKSRAGRVRLAAPLQRPPAVLAAVGDIACEPGREQTRKTCRQADTAELAASYRPDAVALLGDIQYERGALEDFRASFDPSWGQLQMPLRPVPGNHEYRTNGARDYFAYFAEQARWRPPSWYAYDLGSWHLVALNSNCEEEDVPCGGDEEQVNWLRSELAASPRRCTLAYWHHPRYSSGFHGSDLSTMPFWRVLQRENAEIVLAGHDHDYERFAPQNATGQYDPNGMRSFVAGTGGKDTTPLRKPRAPHSELGRDDAHGIMILRLYDDSYSWRFVRIDGKVLDFGNGSCL